ncbi:helix-turn-helix domain-containing protein [Arenimonas oryziterrae]|uniref:Cytoskeleton protein RodZ-like C-terminal domain-containing protein n=1 Tax=Arenimonas oryziterrae DSM 21050 = YC6267 TaxID=1121015 RepID=A0A091BJG0_9GAMM|nr:helix-turn-helix domain-containing protein [Arenimonas oryziterrae]KFN44435.1 hypothetical protein N789_00070 [Arenimonas oryziterrae DSM 21050 = YC6267]
MSIDSFQETLFEDPIGSRFRHAREKLRWSKESVAQQLKLPISIIDAIEREDWQRLGAAIYVRSYVGSYAKILGLPAETADEVLRVQPMSAPPLVHSSSSLRTSRTFDHGLLKLGSLVMTGVIVGSIVMVVMYFQKPAAVAEVLPLDPPTATTSGATAGTQVLSLPAQATVAPSATAPAAPTVAAPAANTPPTVMASLAPALSAPVGSNELVLDFQAESWVDVVAMNGEHVERGLVPAGTQRRYAAGQVSRITLGNADAVQVSQAGQKIDLAPYREANVARFTVSSQGKVTPSGG